MTQDYQPDSVMEVLAGLVAEKASPVEFSRQLFLLEVASVEDENPDLAFLLRACAIPTFFDDQIIGVLRNTIEDTDGNKTLLVHLQEYHFVLPREDGGFIYHDNIREAVLEDWRKPENQELFSTLQGRLVKHFSSLANDALVAGDSASALRDATRAIEVNPKDVDPLITRATALFRLSEYESSLSDLTRVVQIYPYSSEIYFIRGRVYFENKSYERAIANYSLAIELDADRSDFYRWRALANLELKDDKNAINDLNMGISLAPNEADMYYLRGTILYENKNYDAALNDIHKAVDLQPNQIDHYLFLRRIYRDKGDKQSFLAAIDATSKAIQLLPENGLLYYLRGRIFFDLGQFSEALSDFNLAVGLGYQDEQLLFQRSKLLSATREMSAAIDDLSALIQIHPELPNLYYERASAYLYLNQDKDALQDIQSCLKILLSDPAKMDVNFAVRSYLILRRIYRNLKDNESAIIANTRAIELQPTNGELRYQRGRIYREAGDYAASLYDWQKSIELGYTDLPLYLDRSELYYELGLYEKALADANRIIEADEQQLLKSFPRMDVTYFPQWRERILSKMSK